MNPRTLRGGTKDPMISLNSDSVFEETTCCTGEGAPSRNCERSRFAETARNHLLARAPPRSRSFTIWRPRPLRMSPSPGRGLRNHPIPPKNRSSRDARTLGHHARLHATTPCPSGASPKNDSLHQPYYAATRLFKCILTHALVRRNFQ